MFRSRPPVQGLAQRRARRRRRAERIQRADVRSAHRARLRGGEGRVRPEGPAQSQPDRPRAALRRPLAVPLWAGLWSDRGLPAAPRLVGSSGAVGRSARRGRDVQQQRPLPQVRRRRDVPELSRHARRAASRARPRQYAAARPHRPARKGRVGLERRGGGAEALRLLQGLPARMSDRRRHGQDEDRGDGGACRSARDRAARTARGRTAAVRASRRNLRRRRQSAQQRPAAAPLPRSNVGLCRAARSAGLAARSLPRPRSLEATPAPRARWAT